MPEMMNVATVKAPQRAPVKSWKVREPRILFSACGKRMLAGEIFCGRCGCIYHIEALW